MILQLILQLIIGTFFFLFIITQFNSTMSSLNFYQKINSKKLMQFELTDPIRSIQINENINSLLENWMDKNKVAYTSVNSYTIENYPNVNVVIGIGNFNQIFDLGLNIGDNELCVVLGKNLKEIKIGETIEVGMSKKIECKVSNRLSDTHKYLIGTNVKSLDDSLLILMSKGDYQKLFSNYYLDEFFFNLGVSQAPNHEIITYLEEMENAGFHLLPVSINSLLDKYKNSVIKNDIIFLVFYLVTQFFIICSIIANIVLLQQKNSKEYAIHLLYGAKLRQIYARIICYTSIIVVPPILSTTFFLSYLDGTLVFSIPKLLFCIIMIIIMIVFYPIKTVNKNQQIEMDRGK